MPRLFIVIIAGFCLTACAGTSAPVQTVESMQLSSAEDLRTGEAFAFESLRGRVVVLDFWASWCEPCKKSMPFYDGLAAELAEEGLEVVGVNIDEDRALAERFLSEFPVSFRQLWDRGHTIVSSYAIDKMPTAFLLDRTGTVREVFAGYTPDSHDAIRGHIQNLLKAAPQSESK